MAYIPPHKRHYKEANPTPAPTLAALRNKILYSEESISRWFVIPANDQDGELSCSVRLKEFTAEDTELKHGKKYVILARQDDHPNKEVNENVNHIDKIPWVSITEKIQQDLLTSFQTAREEMCKDGPELNLPSFVIKIGKILFQRSPFDRLEALDSANKSSAVENILSPLRKRFYTNVPESFCKAIFRQFIPKTGLDFLEEQEHIYVRVYDKSQPDKAIMCKCYVTEVAGELQVYKIGLRKIRQMVVDISCLEKNLDLRLLLSSKRILTSLTGSFLHVSELSKIYTVVFCQDDEKQSLNSLVKSAIIHSKVENNYLVVGGKESLCGRYVVEGAILTDCRVYKNSFMRLKIRKADGFDVPDVSLRIPELTSQLRDATMELNPLIDTVRDTLKLVWENFLCWEGSYT